MIVALIADVHANLPALEAVLEDAGAHGAEAVWNLGDLVGYGPLPEETVLRLREAADVNLRGNYDRKVLALPEKRDRWRETKAPEKFEAFRWTWEHLSPEARAYLGSLPETARRTLGGRRVLLVHGSPASDSETLRPTTPEPRMEELARLAEADVVACGHTHRAFLRRVAGVTFVNPGSVGRPEGGDPRAAYALLAAEADDLQIRPRRVRYAVRRTVEAIRAAGLPEDFARMLRQGANLDTIQQRDPDMPTTPPPPPDRPDDADRYQAVCDLAAAYRYEREHTHQVTRLALALFDDLAPMLGLGADERFLLQCGAMLHDIGWNEGRKGHHKTAQRLILAANDLPLDDRERTIVALVARYHRKALPAPEHNGYADLEEADRGLVRALAGILRVADGLDRSHTDAVRHLECAVEPEAVRIRCRTRGPAAIEQTQAEKKGDLLREVLSRTLVIETIPEKDV